MGLNCEFGEAAGYEGVDGVRVKGVSDQRGDFSLEFELGGCSVVGLCLEDLGEGDREEGAEKWMLSS